MHTTNELTIFIDHLIDVLSFLGNWVPLLLTEHTASIIYRTNVPKLTLLFFTGVSFGNYMLVALRSTGV